MFFRVQKLPSAQNLVERSVYFLLLFLPSNYLLV